MALATYADLTANVASYLARDDLTANIPDFITLFEATAARRMKLRYSEATANLTTISGSVALPSGYLGYRRLTWNGSSTSDVRYVAPALLQSYYPTSPQGVPTMFTIEASTIKVRPIDDVTTLTLLYNAKNAALSSALNWLYTNHPDAYLFGALAEAAGFNIDFDKMMVWKARRDEVFDEIKLMAFRENGSMAVRVQDYTP